MGNLCFSYNIQQLPKKHHCKKCYDKFIVHYGGKSQRASCRYHNYIARNGHFYCINCDRFKSEIKCRNCYHSVHKD